MQSVLAGYQESESQRLSGIARAIRSDIKVTPSTTAPHRIASHATHHIFELAANSETQNRLSCFAVLKYYSVSFLMGPEQLA